MPGDLGRGLNTHPCRAKPRQGDRPREMFRAQNVREFGVVTNHSVMGYYMIQIDDHLMGHVYIYT